jgi:hypothetical protein
MRPTRLTITSRFVTGTGQWIPGRPAQPPIAKPIPGEATMRPKAKPTPAPTTKMPGQRTKRRLWKGEAVAERSVMRGSWRRRRNRKDGQDVFDAKPGQEVFAETTEPEETSNEHSHPDPDHEWFQNRATVRPVIGGRKTDDHSGG